MKTELGAELAEQILWDTFCGLGSKGKQSLRAMLRKVARSA